MEKCPDCKDYTLSYDSRRGFAVCNKYDCDYIKKVENSEDYFKKFVTSKFNWSNYCAKTPNFVRVLRGTLDPT